MQTKTNAPRPSVQGRPPVLGALPSALWSGSFAVRMQSDPMDQNNSLVRLRNRNCWVNMSLYALFKARLLLLKCLEAACLRKKMHQHIIFETKSRFTFKVKAFAHQLRLKIITNSRFSAFFASIKSKSKVSVRNDFHRMTDLKNAYEKYGLGAQRPLL